MSPNPHSRARRFIRDVCYQTPFIKLLVLLTILWLLFGIGMYIVESPVEGATIRNLGAALYWGIAAFSTAGIADTPRSGLGQLLGGTWIVIGSSLFFGGIVATITMYFTRPMQRPHKKIIDTIEFNLEQMNDLTVDELDLLRETVDMLIEHVEQLKSRKGAGQPAE